LGVPDPSPTLFRIEPEEHTKALIFISKKAEIFITTGAIFLVNCLGIPDPSSTLMTLSLVGYALKHIGLRNLKYILT